MRRSILSALAAGLMLLASCKVTVKIPPTPLLGGAEFTAELNPRSGEPARGGQSLGRGTVTMEDGTVLEGEFFDTDEDGKPDKFKPDAGQSGGGAPGSTNGRDWYDIDPQ